jgi:hypothetical protein
MMKLGGTEIAIIERTCTPVFFINGYHQIDHLGGGNYLFTCFRRQTSVDHARREEHEIELRFVANVADILTMREAHIPHVDADRRSIPDRRTGMQ